MTKNFTLPIILDDILDEEQKNKIEDFIFDCNWIFRIDNTHDYSFNNSYRKILNPFKHDISPSICSNVILNNNLFSLYGSLLEKICNNINYEISGVGRCIAGIQGIQLIRNESKICNIHINRSEPHLVILYYVNDCDGDTILYKETINEVPYEEYVCGNYKNFTIDKRISPKRGRVLIFDGNTYHSSSSPSKGIRSIITTDLFGKFSEKNSIMNNIFSQKNINLLNINYG